MPVVHTPAILELKRTLPERMAIARLGRPNVAVNLAKEVCKAITQANAAQSTSEWMTIRSWDHEMLRIRNPDKRKKSALQQLEWAMRVMDQPPYEW